MASGSSSSSEKFPLSWYCNGSELYGVGIGAFSLARQMDKRGWPVQLLHSEQGPLVERFKDAGLATRKIDLPRRSTDYSGSLPAQLLKVARGASFDRHVGKALAEGVRAFGGNHVHVRWPSHLRAAVNARRELGGPCFWEMPNFVSDRYPLGINRRFYQRLCRRGGVTVLANSAATGRTVAGGGVEPITFYVATSVDRFEPIAADRAALGVPEDVVLVAIASRLVADKGGMHLLRAAAKHTTTPGGRAVHVALIGGPLDSDYAANLRRVADEHGMTDRLHMPGQINDVRPWYAAADLTCNLRIEPEPFGLSVIESMLMEVPVLVHAHGGPAETIVDGQTGWHIGSMDQSDVDAGFARALADELRWQQLGQAARTRALTHFSDTAVADHYERLLAQV